MTRPERPLTRGDIMDAGEVADLLGVSRNTVLEWRRNGTLPALVRGSVIRFRRWEVEAFVAGDATPATGGGQR